MAGKVVRSDATFKVPASDMENFFLVGVHGQWKAGADRPALLQSDRALAYAHKQTQLALEDLLAKGEMSLEQNKLDVAQKLYEQAQQFAPHSPRAKGGLVLVEKMKTGKKSRADMLKELRKDAAKREVMRLKGDGKRKIEVLADGDEKEEKLPGGVDPRDPLDDVKARRAIAEQQANIMVNEAIRQANRLVRSSPDEAYERLKRTRDSVKDNPDLQPASIAGLTARLSQAMGSISRIGATIKRDQGQALALRAAADARLDLRRSEVLAQDRVRERLRVFRNLMDQAREEEAFRQALAIRNDLVSQGQPIPPSVTFGMQASLNGYHLREVQELKRVREDRFLATLLEVERSHVPFPDEPPVEFPSAAAVRKITRGQFDNWPDFAKYRIARYSGVRLHQRRARPAVRVAEPAEQDGGLRRSGRSQSHLDRRTGSAGAGLPRDLRRQREGVQVRDAQRRAQDGDRQPQRDSADENHAGHRAQEDPGARPGAFRRDVHDPPRRDRDHHRAVRHRRENRARLPRGRPRHAHSQRLQQERRQSGPGGPGAAAAEYDPGCCRPVSASLGGGVPWAALGALGAGRRLGPWVGGGRAALGGCGWSHGGRSRWAWRAASLAGGMHGCHGGAPGLMVGGFNFMGNVNLGVGGGMAGFGGGQLGQLGNLGGQFGLQGGNQSQLLITLIRQVVGRPKDWAPQYNPITGQPLNPLDDEKADGGGGINGDNNQLGYYPPALALVVKAPSLIHARASNLIVTGGGAAADKMVAAPGGGGRILVNGGRPRIDVAGDGDERDPKKKKKLDAKEVWQEALAKGVEQPGLIIATADYLALNQKFDHAAEFLKANLRQGVVVKPWVYKSLAIALRESGGSAEDIERAEVSAADLEPLDGHGYLQAARALAQDKNYERALAFCKQAAELEPGVPTAYADAARYADMAGDPKAMQWAAGHLLRQDWPVRNDELHRTALERLESLAKRLDRVEGKRLLEKVNGQRRRDLVVKLLWQGEADLDLKVEEPTGSFCTALSKQTIGGGTLIADALASMTSESYAAAEGFSGEYKVWVERVWGKPLGNKAQLKIIRHQGTTQETEELVTVRLQSNPLGPGCREARQWQADRDGLRASSGCAAR